MQNIKTKKRQKTARLVLAMTLMSLLPLGAFPQEEGLFQRGVNDEAYYGFGGTADKAGLLGNRSETTGTINNQIFGQPVPLGSGVLLLIAAGAGYAILKRKEDEQ